MHRNIHFILVERIICFIRIVYKKIIFHRILQYSLILEFLFFVNVLLLYSIFVFVVGWVRSGVDNKMRSSKVGALNYGMTIMIMMMMTI